MKTQFQMMGEWITILSFSVEILNDIRFISMQVEDVSPKKLKSLADWVSKTWKADIVAIVGT